MGDRRVDLRVPRRLFLLIHLAGIADIGDDQPIFIRPIVLVNASQVMAPIVLEIKMNL